MEKSFYLLGIIVILSCNGQKKIAAQQEAKSTAPLTLVAQDNFSGADSTETMVITNAKALKSFYSRVNRTRKPGLPVPEIDFSKEMVVILCSANEVSQKTDGLAVVEESDIEIVFGRPQMSKNTRDTPSSDATPLISPFFVYKMPLTDKRVSFKKLQ